MSWDLVRATSGRLVGGGQLDARPGASIDALRDLSPLRSFGTNSSFEKDARSSPFTGKAPTGPIFTTASQVGATSKAVQTWDSSVFQSTYEP